MKIWLRQKRALSSVLSISSLLCFGNDLTTFAGKYVNLVETGEENGEFMGETLREIGALMVENTKRNQEKGALMFETAERNQESGEFIVETERKIKKALMI